MDLEQNKKDEAAASRERIIEHGQLGIKLEPAQLRQLFELADSQKSTPQLIARKWILEALKSNAIAPTEEA